MTASFFIRRPAGNATSPVQKMRTLLLLLLLLSVGASALKRIVHRIVEEKTWDEAQAYCRRHHTDLLTIRNDAENDEITDEGWIGFRYKRISLVNWKWKWSDGHDYNFWTWSNGEPYASQHCGLKTAGDPALHGHSCYSKKPFYCVHDLILVEEQKSWEEALEYCRHLAQHQPTVANHRYRLASPLTNVYSEDVFQGGFNKVWIGLRYLGDQWLWLNGQHSNDHLANCPPIHRCGTLEKNVTANIANRKCDAELFFLCQKI